MLSPFTKEFPGFVIIFSLWTFLLVLLQARQNPKDRSRSRNLKILYSTPAKIISIFTDLAGEEAALAASASAKAISSASAC